MRWLTLLASSAAAIAVLAAPAGAKTAGSKLKVPLPAPGHISLETVKITVKGKSRGLPARLKLKAIKAASLPPSVRVLYAHRKIRRKKSTTYALLLMSVNVAGARATTSTGARISAEGSDLFAGPKGTKLDFYATLLLFFGSPVAAEYISTHETEEQEKKHQPLSISTKLSANADLAPPTEVQKIGKMLDDLYSNGQGGLVFEKGSNDPNLDTGHYDDGHAFGWKVKTPADEVDVFNSLSAFTNNQVSGLIAEIEQKMGADVNGDGGIAAPGSGQAIDTIIGPPVIR